MKQCGYVLSALIFGSLCFAQTVNKVDNNSQSEASRVALQRKLEAGRQLPGNAPADNSCAFTFTSGSGNTSLEYCVSANGNIPELQSPVGHALLSLDRGEGYGICDITNEPNIVGYDDYSSFGDSGNLGPATVLSQSATSVKIARTTTDGIWTLTQTITQVPSNQSVKIAMTLKNNTAAIRTARLVRYADVDVDGVTDNNFDGTFLSVFAWNSTFPNFSNAFGLLLQNVGNSNGVEVVGLPQNDFHPPDPCHQHSLAGPLVSVDGSLVLLYQMPPIPKSGSRTITMAYKGL